METITERLKMYFENTSPEQVKKDWEKTKKYDKVKSPSVKDFNKALKVKSRISERVDYYNNILAEIPTNSYGMINQEERKKTKYQHNKIQFNYWFKELQEINKYIVSNFKKQNREYQISKRFEKTTEVH